ncbi:hypothetical protein, partial [Candidatus Blastococcus massiliensis]|uniref:hypothetical protein n=1 Tax=Candidatus Blastococcus massiliensis TaxID=1470358 RepID=UPI00058B86A2
MGALAGLSLPLLVLLAAAVVTAPSAAAIDDPSRPDARVTHGPSCRPGGLVVEVVAGTAPYAVRLATTRTPAGEDEAVLAPGETVVLRTGDVAPGETIDGRLEFTAQDGSTSTYADELDGYTFTRPTTEECEAANSPQPQPQPPSTPAPPATPSPEPSPEPSPGPSPGPAPSAQPSPQPTSPQPTTPPAATPPT